MGVQSLGEELAEADIRGGAHVVGNVSGDEAVHGGSRRPSELQLMSGIWMPLE